RLDKLDLSEISNRLRTKLIGKRLIFREVVDSTMNIARQNAGYEGLVVIAERQTAGRGRSRKRWISPGGGLWFSVIFKPKVVPQSIPLVGIFSAISIAKAIETCADLHPRLKWPNDILIGNKKVCGISTEAIFEAGEIRSVIVGAGLNNNFLLEELPEEIRDKATTLMIEAGHPVEPIPLLCKIFENMEYYYEAFKRGNTGKIISDWEVLSMVKGAEVLVRSRRGEFRGKAIGIDEWGRLIVEDENGIELRLSTGIVESIEVLK
ncbi:MAG: biotin--[acetyl-CoA-carboxylase] ligase, partial [Thermoprotei archaeon]